MNKERQKQIIEELEEEKTQAIFIVLDGSQLHYHYTNMGAGAAVDVLKVVEKILLGKLSS